jgi:hypothetical protein
MYELESRLLYPYRRIPDQQHTVQVISYISPTVMRLFLNKQTNKPSQISIGY